MFRLYNASTPKKPEIKDTTDTVKSALYLDLHLQIDRKKNYWPNYTTNTMIYYSVLATFHSFVATSLLHLRMKFSNHNSLDILKLAVSTQTFCTALSFLQLGLWNMILLLQDWSHHYWSFSVAISWTLGPLWCIHLHH